MLNENKKVRVILSQKEVLIEFVKKQIDNWFELKVKDTHSKWFHIHKYIDLVRINAEGYNTPPLTTLEIDIENLSQPLSDEISKYVYEYLQEKLHVDKESEFLTYSIRDMYFKEENELKNELFSEEDEQIGEEEKVEGNNQILSIFQSLRENGNCKVYCKCDDFYGNYKGLYVYNLSVDDNGRLNINLELRFYDFIIWDKNGIDIKRVNSYYHIQKIPNDMISNIVNIFNFYECGEKVMVSSHKSNKKQDRTLALNELYLYINQMYNIFGNDSSLETNSILAQWIKGSPNGRLNIFHSTVKPSYDEMLNNLTSSADRFRSIYKKARQDWEKLKNADYFLVTDETNKPKSSR